MADSGPTPVVFGPAGRGLFGFYHPPSGERRPAVGLVLCNPLGYEAMCTHRTYRHLAERAAARGLPALRFDYEGTGDSAGRPDSKTRVRAWLDSVAMAIGELRARSGVRRVALFGVRFGATLAATAATEQGDVDALVLWAPCASGRAYVRELRAFRLIKAKEPPRANAAGDEEVAGYLFDRATVADMSTLDLLARPPRTARRALVLPGALPGVEARLAPHLEGAGCDVTARGDSGYGLMMRDPQDTIVPEETVAAIVDWLAEGAPAETSPGVAPAAAPPPLLSVAAASGAVVREEAVTFGDGERLFGIVTEPKERAPVQGAPALLFLNVGANHRVGPNRMYVSMARDLAGMGYFGFRFDVAGLGDSRLAPGAREQRLYSKDSVVDVKAAMDFIERTRGVKRFILMGLCSGAYLAFHTAVEDARVVGQVLLNPQTFEWREGDSLELSMRKSFLSTRHYARSLLRPATWKRLLGGRLDVRGVALALSERASAQAAARAQALRAWLAGKGEPQSDVERAFIAMSDRGVASLLVFSFEDGGLDMIEAHLGRNVRKMAKRENFHFEIVDGADHTFTPIASQAALHGIVTRYVTAAFP